MRITSLSRDSDLQFQGVRNLIHPVFFISSSGMHGRSQRMKGLIYRGRQNMWFEDPKCVSHEHTKRFVTATNKMSEQGQVGGPECE